MSNIMIYGSSRYLTSVSKYLLRNETWEKKRYLEANESVIVLNYMHATKFHIVSAEVHVTSEA